jgi:hypothetical protein
MTPPIRALLVLLLVFAAPVGRAMQAPSPVEAGVRQAALARLPLAHTVASDLELVKAVLAKNAQKESEAEIRERDRRWMDNPRDPLRRTLVESPCGQRLRDLVKDDPLVTEVILMDEHGANVCVSRATSDYWQGDEAKWDKPFREGADPFVDAPAYDASSGVFAIQLSVPVRKGSARIGALTLTIKVPRSAVAGPNP